MSWAAYNPEAYDLILKSGIVNKLRHEMADNGFDNMDEDTIAAVVEVLCQPETTLIYDRLISWAQRETKEAEADHWATLGDSRG